MSKTASSAHRQTLRLPTDETDLTLLMGTDLLGLPFLWDALIDTYIDESLGLGVYRFGGQHLIGFKDGSSHPHDRWLFAAFEAEHWVRLPAEGFVRSGQDVSVQDLRAELVDLRNMTNRCRIALADEITPAGGILQRARALGLPSRNQFDVYEALVRVPKMVSSQTLHDLIHHYPQWLAENPEFKDMPRDIVLRAHGFGALLEVCDWLFDAD